MKPTDISLTKARYFQSILKVAKTLDEAAALRILKSLINDTTTDGVGGDVLQAEQAALDAVRELFECLQLKEKNPVAAWNKASNTVNKWLPLVS